MKLLKNPLTYIFILALLLRLYKLGIFPYGFHIDEVKVGWNALSILKTGMDDQLKNFPLYYNSFGDYRPTGIFYLTIPSLIIFGNNIFAVRFASALFGSLTVYAIYYLALALSKNKRLATISSLLIAISTWHIEVSRATSEVAISTFFALFSIYFFIKLFELNKRIYLFLSLSLITISYLLYHSIRFLAPLFFISILVFYFKKINRKSIVMLFFVFLVSLFFSTTKEGLKRLDQVSIFQSVDLKYQIERINNEDLKKTIVNKLFNNKYVIYSRFFINQYTGYFGSKFLLDDSARPYRYRTPGVGITNIIEIILVVFGTIEIISKKKNYLPIILLLISPLPAAMTIEDSPNLHRAFFMLPFLIITASYGLIRLYRFKNIIFAGLTLGLMFFIHMYFNHSISHKPYIKDMYVDSPTYRNVGAVELVTKLNEYKDYYDEVIVTNYPDNPYPYYAFLGGLNPSVNKSYNPTTNKRVVDNIIFSEEKCPTDMDPKKYNGKKILFVNNWECGYESQIKAGLPVAVVDKILRPDNSEVYIFLRN